MSNCVCAGRKLVVFVHHSNVLDGLEEAVQGMTYPSESGTELRAGHMRIDVSKAALGAREDLPGQRPLQGRPAEHQGCGGEIPHKTPEACGACASCGQ